MLFLEILLSMLAVYGLYAIICRTVSHDCYCGDLSFAVHHTAGESGDAVRRAVILTEAQNGKMRSPVVLLEQEPSADELAALRECGCRLYSRIL
jgi:hypothetical protein